MSWTKAELSSVCEVFADGDWIESKDQSKNGIRLIQTGNVGLGRFKARDSKARYISEETFKRLRCTEIKQGDILVSRLPDPVGRACVIPQLDEKSITAVDCTIIRTKKEILNTEFLNYFCQSPQYFEQVKTNITGATRQRISRSLLGKTKIPLPPLSTQQKIVAKLNAIFTELDKATVAAEANAKNAELLFQSYLSNIQAPQSTLGELVTIKTGKLDSNASVENGKYPFFTCSKEIFSINDYAFDCEAVLLAGNNASGDFNVKHYKGKFNAYQRTYVITIDNNDKLTYRYLYFQLVNALKRLKSMSVGANTKFLKIGMIRDLKLPVPEIDQQIEILKSLNAIESKTVLLKNSYLRRIELLNKLKQSILMQAYSGLLVKE